MLVLPTWEASVWLASASLSFHTELENYGLGNSHQRYKLYFQFCNSFTNWMKNSDIFTQANQLILKETSFHLHVYVARVLYNPFLSKKTGGKALHCHMECHSSHQWILNFFRVKVKEGATLMIVWKNLHCLLNQMKMQTMVGSAWNLQEWLSTGCSAKHGFFRKLTDSTFSVCTAL